MTLVDIAAAGIAAVLAVAAALARSLSGWRVWIVNSRWTLSAVIICGMVALISSSTLAQIPGSRVPGGCDVPAAARSSEIGCYLTATEELKTLPPGDLFWHLYEYPTRALAEAAKPAAFGTVTESLGKIWLYAIQRKDWRPRSGARVTVIGPLPLRPGVQYTARYMEAVFPPGMQTAVHTHSGPEAWYILNGTQCLQTPDTVSVTRAGAGAVIPAGPPMILTSLGNEMRRSVVLVLHDAMQPWMTITPDWKPANKCPQE